MKSALIAACIFAASLLTVPAAHADTMAYPTADNTSFLIDYPSDWELTPADTADGYATLTGPSGAILMFRTIEGSETALEGAVKDSYAYVTETYKDVKLDEPKESVQRGLKGFYGTGSGTDDEAGKLGFVMAWYALNDGHIGEIWYAVTEGDEEGHKAAVQILDSFRAP